MACSILAWTRNAVAFAAIVLAPAGHEALAAEAQTFTDPFNVPVFETVDARRVDLVRGVLRERSPMISQGSDAATEIVGLEWTGKAWTYVDQPSIWRRDGTYIVRYAGRTIEFGGKPNFEEKAPVTGSKLDCAWDSPGNQVRWCTFFDRSGDIVDFTGRLASITPYPASLGLSCLRYGNMAITGVSQRSADRRDRNWGLSGLIYDCEWEKWYRKDIDLTIGNRRLLVTTPNQDGTKKDVSYLRPKSTTQTITDDAGSIWTYTFDGNRNLVRVDYPQNVGNKTISYNGSGKVASVSDPYGTWTYRYTSGDTFGTTTVTAPDGSEESISYNKEKGYVTEHRDQLQRVTRYDYDASHRLVRVVFPEQNSLEFAYDDRGNIIRKTTWPKPGGGSPLVESASYPVSCADPIRCNLPTAIEDARGNRTELEYPAPETTILRDFSSRAIASYPWGTRQPSQIRRPAPGAGQAAPRIVNSYKAGVLTRSAECMTLSACQSGPDEVVTTYEYGGTEATTRLLFGKVVSWNGKTLRTCYGYDDQGRRVSETPATAQLTACPTTITQSLPANAIAPVAPYPLSQPVFADAASR